MALATTTTTPTGWANDAAYQNFQRAQQVAGQPYQQYQGNMLAGWNQGQTGAYNSVLNGMGTGQAAMAQGQQAAQQAAAFQAPQVSAQGYNPAMQGVTNTQAASAGPAALANAASMQAAQAGPAYLRPAFDTAAISAGNAAQMSAAQMAAANAGQANTMTAAQMAAASAGPAAQMQAQQAALAQAQAAALARGNVRDVAAQNFTQADLSKYLNPYTGAVIDTTMNTLSRQNDLVNQQTNARAAAAGAFGGSRQAVANSENNRAYLDTVASTTAGLNNSNFAQAQAAIGTDQQRALQAALANQSQDWNVGNLNTSNAQQTALQNMLASNQTSQFNATNRQNASQWNAGATNQQSQYNAGLTQQANLQNSNLSQAANAANMAALNSRQEYNAGLQQQANQVNSGYQQSANASNQAATNNMSQYNASNAQSAAAQTAAAHNSAAAEQMAALNNFALTNAGYQQQANSANAGYGQAANLANAAALNNQAQYNANNQQTSMSQTAAAHNAALANQAQAQNAAGQFNSDLGLRAQLANQGAAQNAINTNLSAGNALNGMGLDQQQQMLNAANASYNMGQGRTAYDQAGLTNAYQQWAAQQAYPQQQLGILQSGLAGVPYGQTSTGPGQQSNTGANILAGVLGAGALGAGVLANGSSIASGASALSGMLPDIGRAGWGGWFG